jgi:hypothetical protein
VEDDCVLSPWLPQMTGLIFPPNCAEFLRI